jgi:hypothetical protein
VLMLALASTPDDRIPGPSARNIPPGAHLRKEVNFHQQIACLWFGAVLDVERHDFIHKFFQVCGVFAILLARLPLVADFADKVFHVLEAPQVEPAFGTSELEL